MNKTIITTTTTTKSKHLPVILSASTSLRSSKTPPPVNRLLTLVSSSLVDCAAVVSPAAADEEEAVVESSLLFPFESFSATKFLYSISGILNAGILLLNKTASGVFSPHYDWYTGNFVGDIPCLMTKHIRFWLEFTDVEIDPAFESINR